MDGLVVATIHEGHEYTIRTRDTHIPITRTHPVHELFGFCQLSIHVRAIYVNQDISRCVTLTCGGTLLVLLVGRAGGIIARARIGSIVSQSGYGATRVHWH